MNVLFYGLRCGVSKCTISPGQKKFTDAFPIHMLVDPRTLGGLKIQIGIIMKFQFRLPTCRPSNIFFTSALSLETSSLEAEASDKAFKSFSTASIRLTCAETWTKNYSASNCMYSNQMLTFSVLTLSCSMLVCNAAEARWYSSNKWYAAKDEAKENPKRKPMMLI